MEVVKRDGTREKVDFNKIHVRLDRLAKIAPALDTVDLPKITQTVVAGVADGIDTRELDSLAAETAASYTAENPEYSTLAARIVVSDLHKRTPSTWLEVVSGLHGNMSQAASGLNVHAPLVTDELLECAQEFGQRVDAHTYHDRDHSFYDYFGIKTFLQGYTLLVDGEPAERPCHVSWRVAFGVHGKDFERAKETYDALVAGAMTHASPTLFYAGTPKGSLSSCFLDGIHDDSINSIYEAVKDCAVISKSGGGIGLAVSKVRGAGALVRSTGRAANGVLPALRVLNETARHVTQGGRRKGAIAVYIEPHHADVFNIIGIRLNHGLESNRCRDLFPALWVSDLFMVRVREDDKWTLMSPDTAPGLDEVYGLEYQELYERYEVEGKGVRTVPARELWNAIMTAQIETGTPYLLFKDTVNRANSQANVGIVRCSNLCSEITLHVDEEETAVCNLASIALPHFVDEDTYTFDFDRLAKTVAMTVRNLDAVIDRTYNPTEQCRVSNAHNRPIGIGVQGLADVFMMLRMPFDSDQARALNTDIFERMYRAALEASCDLAAEKGVYPTYEGSPASQGKLQPDLHLKGSFRSQRERDDLRERVNTEAWTGLRARIARDGLRHSVTIALMPTASTAQLMGNTEAFEAIGSNLYVRRTLAGEFTVINKRMVRDLQAIGAWTKQTRDAIIRADGSVQGLNIPHDLKSLYRTVWEISQKSICRMAADRTPFVDQSQSLNIHMAAPTQQKLSSLHFFNWDQGLKTSSYYLRTQAASAAIKFTLDPQEPARETAPSKCDQDACLMCGA